MTFPDLPPSDRLCPSSQSSLLPP
ncbi:hypothetical protein V2J09_005870 [Rumex salicifolius]